MKKAILFLFFVTCATPVFCEEAGGLTFSFLAFGDYYYIAADHKEDIEGENGFWFRRVYFTVDKGLGDSFDVRFRLEMNSSGDFTSSDRLEPFVKDLYLRWKQPSYQVYLGLSPTPTWEFVESFWDYRFLEKTIVDLQRMGTPRDLGVALRGGSGRIKYHFNVGNGSGERAEINQGKAVMGSLRFDMSESASVEFYADYNALPGNIDRTTLQGFFGYRKSSGRIGIQYVHQSFDGATVDNLDALSLFGVYKLNEKLSIVGRYDRMFDANPEGSKIPYIPFSPDAKSNLLIGAVDISLHKNLNLTPNVEVVKYDGSGTGPTPGTDVIPRLTFYFRY